MRKGDVVLTDTRVRNLANKGERYLVFDQACPGFGVRVSADGKTKKFFAKTCTSVDGVQRRQWFDLGDICGITTVKAREEASRLKRQVKEGVDPRIELEAMRGAPLVGNLLDRFYSEILEVAVSVDSGRLRVRKLARGNAGGARRGYESVRLAEKFIRPTFGATPAKDISTSEISLWFTEIKKETPVQANRALSVARQFFNAVEIWKFRPDGSNPTLAIKRKKETSRDEKLTDGGIAALGVALRAAAEETEEQKGAQKQKDQLKESPFALAAIKLILLTGMRKGEALGLRWEWVDVDTGLVTIPPAFHKTGKESKKNRIVYLCVHASELIESLPRVKENPYVFPGKVGGEHIVDLHGPWRRIRAKAGLADPENPCDEDISLHDLRRTFGSVAGDLKVPDLFISGLLGHEAANVTEVYTHLSEDPLREAVERVGERIHDLLSGQVDVEAEARATRQRRIVRLAEKRAKAVGMKAKGRTEPDVLDR